MYFLYRMIKEENSIFWGVIAWVMVRKNSSYEHVSNSEWLPRQSCLNLQTHFWLRGWKKCEVYKRKVGTRNELFARILDAAARIKKREDQLRRTKRNLPHELQSALRLTVWEFRTFIVICQTYVIFVFNFSYKQI